MDLRQRLTAWAYARPHLLIVECPGSWRVRAAVEGFARSGGWPLAASPAAADLLVVCGRPSPALAEQVDRVCEQLPGPRSRVLVVRPEDVARDLGGARDALLDDAVQRADALARADEAGGMDVGGMDMGGMDMGGMELPGGLGMAGQGPDRDGLQLDVLHVQLGPLLPDWPAGLRAALDLQGDVVVGARMSALPAVGALEPPPGAVDALDRVARVLRLAGSRHAGRAQELRDRALAGATDTGGCADLARAVGRDRVLRWSLRGLPAAGGRDLWQQLLDLLADGGAGRRSRTAGDAELADLVVGQELAGVRLTVAAHLHTAGAGAEVAGRA